ncbi:MAG: Ig-like domain-containing protein [Firmicutes bacterium]|nr:Ig-like domain-containing protein [Bacillota bacterium]
MKKTKITLLASIFIAIMMMATIILAACPPPSTESSERPGDSPGNIAVTAVTIAPATPVSLAMGTTTQLTATVAPNNATNRDVTWVSSNTAAATVNAEGVVTAVAVGTTNITASAGGITSQAVVVTVTPVIESITLSPNPLNIVVGQTPNNERILSATSMPEAAANPTAGQLTFTVYPEGFVTVTPASGLVTATTAGTGTITATLTSNPEISATVTVNVTTPPVTAVAVSSPDDLVFMAEDIESGENNTARVIATVTPSQAATTINWTSNSPSVTVTPVERPSEAGANTHHALVTAVNSDFSTAIITATSAEYTQHFGTIEIAAMDRQWVRISSIEEFLGINDLIQSPDNRYSFYLSRNLDFSAVPPIQRLGTPMNTGRWASATSVGTLRGIFDGRGHTITNLRYLGGWYGGLFNRVYGGTIRNVTFDNLQSIQLTGAPEGQGGLLIGHGRFTVENVFLSGSIDREPAAWYRSNGMIAGYTQAGSVVRNVIIEPRDSRNTLGITLLNFNAEFDNVFLQTDRFTPPAAGYFTPAQGGSRYTGRTYTSAYLGGATAAPAVYGEDTINLFTTADLVAGTVPFNRLPAANWTLNPGALPSFVTFPPPQVRITAPQSGFLAVHPLRAPAGQPLDFRIVVNTDHFSGTPSVQYSVVGGVTNQALTHTNYTVTDNLRTYNFRIPGANVLADGAAIDITQITGIVENLSISGEADGLEIRDSVAEAGPRTALGNLALRPAPGAAATFVARVLPRYTGIPVLTINNGGGTTQDFTGVVVAGYPDYFTFTLPHTFLPAVGAMIIENVAGLSVRPSQAIATAAEFNAIADDPIALQRDWHLTANIDFAGAALIPFGGEGGTLGAAANQFTGIFDGRGFMLSNFTIEADFHNGIFRNLSGAIVRNLGIYNGTMDQYYQGQSGLIAGRVMDNTLIENIRIVNSSVTGGAAGFAYTNAALAGLVTSGSQIRNVIIDVEGEEAFAAFVLANEAAAGEHSNIFIMDRTTPAPYIVHTGTAPTIFWLRANGDVRASEGVYNREAYTNLPSWAWTVGASGIPTLITNPTMPT